MLFNTLLAAAVSVPLASAAIIDVFVGGTDPSGALQLSYQPSSVTANVGDSIRFTFGVKNHTVTQSTFADPCTAMPGGFFSGYMPVAAGQSTDLPQFWIPVKDTKPIWAFCSQTGHCGKGMVFAVNAPADPAANSFSNYLAKATSGSAVANAGASPTVAAAASTDTAAAANAYGGDAYGGGSVATDASVTTTAAVAATTAGTASGTVHTVVVGGTAGLVYTPSQITAQPGDTVQFQFMSKNHTVTQSTFANPCGAMTGGFDSGFMPNANNASPAPTYNFVVKDSSPVWAYCRQAGHCTSGMVFAINVNTTSPNSFSAFQTNAKSAAASAATTSSSSSSYGSGAFTVASNAKLSWASFFLVSLGFAVFL